MIECVCVCVAQRKGLLVIYETSAEGMKKGGED